MKAASHHAVTDSFNHLNSIVGTDVAAARMMRLGPEDLSNLTEDEQFSLAFLMLGFMRIFETLYSQRENGTAEEQLFLSEQNSLRWVFAFPGTQEWWNTNIISFSPEFREFIGALIAEIGRDA